MICLQTSIEEEQGKAKKKRRTRFSVRFVFLALRDTFLWVHEILEARGKEEKYFH